MLSVTFVDEARDDDVAVELGRRAERVGDDGAQRLAADVGAGRREVAASNGAAVDACRSRRDLPRNELRPSLDLPAIDAATR